MKEGGSGRRAAVQKALDGVGGKLEAFYFAFGKDDAYVIVDVPDNASVIAVSLAVNASGVVRVSTTPLISPDDLDAASKNRSRSARLARNRIGEDVSAAEERRSTNPAKPTAGFVKPALTGVQTTLTGLGARHVLGARSFGTLSCLERYGLALAQLAERDAVQRRLVKEVFVAVGGGHEPESLVADQPFDRAVLRLHSVELRY